MMFKPSLKVRDRVIIRVNIRVKVRIKVRVRIMVRINIRVKVWISAFYPQNICTSASAFYTWPPITCSVRMTEKHICGNPTPQCR